jgi:L-ornithine N5-oxygenase
MTNHDQTVDILGIGFGPAAISVATAIEDDWETLPPGGRRLSARFLDRAPNAAWQPNMLLAGTDIQHHFLRDFATPRNPRSRFTFPNYLVDTDRFFPFTLMGGYVSRHEWNEYVVWTTNKLTLPVQYDTDVVSVVPVVEDGRVVAARVLGRHTGTGETSEHLARNVLVSIGHSPFVPEIFVPHVGPRVFHSTEFLPRIGALPEAPRRIAVVGAGQNAGEIFLHMANAYPQAQVFSIARNSGFRMYNLGHFSNEAYFPAETDYFYALDRPTREKVFDEVYTTNYACVDPDVSTALYRMVYEDHHWGQGRLHMRKRTAIDACAATPGGGYRLALREVNTGETDELDVDLIVCCTGFREPRLPAMLEPFRPYVRLEDSGDPVVSRDFRLGVTPDCEVGVYLNGITEWRHGINSATSFSTMAIKAGDILRDVQRSLAGPAPVDPARNGHAVDPVVSVG